MSDSNDSIDLNQVCDEEPKRLRAVCENDVLVLQMIDPKLYDAIVVNEFEEELLASIEEHEALNVLIDFTGVTQCSTAVINSLLNAWKRVRKAGGALKLCDMKETVRAAYRILNLEGHIFEIHDDRESALASFK